MKTSAIIILFAALWLCLYAQTPDPTWQWAVSGGGISSDYGQKIARDNAGNLYILGTYSGSADFGTTTLTAQGGNDVFVAKLSSSGNWLWAVSAGGAYDDAGTGIIVDALGDVYICGYFQDIIYFGTQWYSSEGNYDFYVAKLNSSGVWQWANSAGGVGNDMANALALGPTGELFVTGSFSGTMTVANATLNTSGNTDIFIALVNSTNGMFIDAISAGGANADTATSIAVDLSGRCYIAGGYTLSTTFGAITLTAAGSFSDVFVARLSPTGGWDWAISGGGSMHDVANGLALDASDNCYVIGNFNGTATFGASVISALSTDLFVAKVASTGDWSWAVRGGGALADAGIGVRAHTDGNCYVTGFFQGNSSFGSLNLISNGARDVFVGKLDPNGTWLWVVKGGGSDEDFGRALVLDPDGNCYVCGYFLSDSGGASSFGTTNLTSRGAEDVFVAKLGYAGISTPVIYTLGTLDPFNTTEGIPSDPQTYQLYGTDLTGDITIAPPYGFEVSVDGGTNYYATSVAVPPTFYGMVNVRMTGLTDGYFEGNIEHSSPGAGIANIWVEGLVVATPAILEVIPLTWDYGSVPLGEPLLTTITLNCYGSPTSFVEVTNIWLDDPYGDFSLFNPPTTPFYVWGGTSEYVDVVFTPTSLGMKENYLNIDEPTSAPHQVYLTGVGDPPTSTGLSVSPTSYDFENTVAVGDSGSCHIYVSLSPNYPLVSCTLQNAALTGDPAFSLSPSIMNATGAPVSLPYELLSSEVLTFTVNYSPTNTSPQTATVNFMDEFGYLVTCNLAGTGAPPALGPLIEVTPPTIDVTMPENSIQDGEFNINNNGDSDLTWYIEPGYSPPFMSIYTVSGTILPGEQHLVSYDINSAGLPLGLTTNSITINSNDATHPNYVVPVSVTVESALDPLITLNPSSVSLTLAQNTIYNGNFEIINSGGATLDYVIAPTGLPPNVTVLNPAGSLAGGQTAVINYLINTSGLSPGAYQRLLDVQSNDPFDPTVYFTIDFNVVSDAIVVDFHAVPLNGHPPLLVHFYDDSTVQTGSTSAAISGWRWDFNNDGIVDSYVQNPIYTYNLPGLYSVRLTVISSAGQYHQLLKQDYIHVGNLPPIVLPGAPTMQEFMEDELGGPFSLSEIFEDPDGDPLSYTIQGSANISGYIGYRVTQEPVLYLTATPNWFGTEVITLTATDPYNASVSHDLTITVLPVNDPPVVNVPPDLHFIRNSTFHVDFADYITDPDNLMSQLSIEIQQVTGTGLIQYVYTPVNLPNQLGQFTVDFSSSLQTPYFERFRIIVNDHVSRATTVAEFNVHVLEQFDPQVGLGANYQYTGQTIQFLNLTLGNPDWWWWDFGDGNTSLEQNPSHTYEYAGTYTVIFSLMNTEALLGASITLIDYITLEGTAVNPTYIPPNWTLAGSPYNLFGEIIIEEDEDVEIEDGVEVNLFDTNPLQIRGMLQANGVTFRGQTGSGFWGGLRFFGTNLREPSELTDCLLVDALLPIEIEGQSPLIEGLQITVSDTTQVVDSPAIKITGAASPNISDAEILNYGKGIEIETEPGARDAASLTNIRIRNSLETTRNPYEGSVGGSIRSDAILHNIEIENVETGLIIEQGEAYRDTADPSLTNIRVRNSLETTRNQSFGLLISGDIAPQIDSLLIEGVTSGIVVQGGSDFARSTTSLTNIRIRTSLETTRTETVGIGLAAVPAITINDAEIEGFYNGIQINNDLRDLSEPSLTNIRVRNSLETTRQENVGISVTGAVVATIDDALIEDYPFGIKYFGTPTRSTSTTSLTNIRVRTSLETTRQATIGIQLRDLGRVIMENDSIGGYTIGLEIINTDYVRSTTDPSLTNIRVRNSLETTRYDNVGIFLGAGVGGTLTGAEIEEARIGIFIADGNLTNLGTNRIFNCETGIKAAGSLLPKPIRRQLIVLEPPFQFEHPEWEFRAFDISLFGPWFIENNTINGYQQLVWAQDAEIAFTNNIGWTWQAMPQPFVLDNSLLLASYCDLGAYYPGPGNINAYPEYIDPAARDYGITYNSPCIDAGSPLLPPDGDGTVSDIGAFPYLHRASMMADKRFIQPGDIVTFTNTSLGHDHPISTTQWDLNNDGTIEATTRNWQHQFNTPGIYHLALTMTTGNLEDVRVYNAVVVVQDDLLMPPENPQLAVQGNDILISWDAVNSTVDGTPIAVEFYIVYSSDTPTGYFDLVGYAEDFQTNLLHVNGAGSNQQFYIVLGYAGTRGQLLDYLQNHPRLLIGDREIRTRNRK